MELLLMFIAASVAMGILANRRRAQLPTVVVLILIAIVATGYLSRRFVM